MGTTADRRIVATHRAYGRLPMAESDAFIDMAVDEGGGAAGTAVCETAWRRWADVLKREIVDARQSWARVGIGYQELIEKKPS